MRQVRRVVYRIFGRMPWFVQRLVLVAVQPSYLVGASAIVVASNGDILLARHSYKRGWAAPGGFLNRREGAGDAAAREVWEECGLRVEVEGEPVTLVRIDERIVELVYRVRPTDESTARSARPVSVEIVELAWFAQDELPTDLTPITRIAIDALAEAEAARIAERGVEPARRVKPVVTR